MPFQNIESLEIMDVDHLALNKFTFQQLDLHF